MSEWFFQSRSLDFSLSKIITAGVGKQSKNKLLSHMSERRTINS
jgi:hypothetical protein